MHQNFQPRRFQAATAHLGGGQLAQASQFFSVGLTTFICTCRIAGRGRQFIAATGIIANDNEPATSKGMQRALNNVADYLPFIAND